MRRLRDISILVLGIVCILYPFFVLIVSETGFLHWQVYSFFETRKMFFELFLIALFLIFGYKYASLHWIVFILLAFSYLHSMFLPVLVAFIYMLFIYLLGRFINEKVFKCKEEGQECVCFFIGINSVTIIYAILSLLKVGSIANLILLDLILFVVLLIYFKQNVTACIKKVYISKGKVLHEEYIAFAVMAIFFMIAIGRANISLDYDSMWYGLRIPYVLNPGSGIYEQLNLTGVVYAYPKGFEVFVMPLTAFESYGFLYACNIFLGAALCYVSYLLFTKFMKRQYALWSCVFLTSIQGIMNMTITAKPDIITLLIQVFMVYLCVLYFEKNKASYIWMLLAAYVYTQTLKTTAVIFSTTIIIAFVFICLVNKTKIELKSGKRYIGLSIITLFFIWLRTYLITGIPASSIWGWFFRAIGMKDKYPYSTGQILQVQTNSVFSEENIEQWMNRLKDFFFSPNSADTDHIIIAWGTTLVTFLLISFIIIFLMNLKKHLIIILKDKKEFFIVLLAIGELALCIIIFLVGVKPDGNYFILMYFTSLLCGAVYWMREFVEGRGVISHVIKCAVGVIVCLNVVISSTINWAWVASFSPIDLVNEGYYNHVEEFRQIMYESNCGDLYEEMVEDKNHRVLAYGEHPMVERIPCIVESSLDVNFWGNSQLMSTKESFLEFVDYVEYDYIFIWNGHLKVDTQDFVNVCSLFESNLVKDFKISGTSALITLGDGSQEQNQQWLQQLAIMCQ